MEIVDPHHHLWSLKLNYYPWLTDKPKVAVFGPYDPIKKDYLLVDFRNETKEYRITKSVHIQAQIDPENPIAETRWLQSVAELPESNGIPNGIVGYCDLAGDDPLRVLEGHAESANFRGIRQILNTHKDKRLAFSDIDYLNEQKWLKNFSLLDRFNANFDMQVYPHQMKDASRLASMYPNIPIVLNHTGMPYDQTRRGIAEWRDGMKLLAECENVTVKISGLGMMNHRWDEDSIRQFVLETIDIYGVERCMFASNFPVDKLFSSYDIIWNAYFNIVRDMSGNEKVKLFKSNAERIYRI